MTQYNFTLELEEMQKIFNKKEGPAKVLEVIVNQILKQQASEQLQADEYERTDERVSYRNGYRERGLTTRVGTIILKVPKFRDGSFSTEIFERYQRGEKALVLTLMEMVINGVSTRKVSRIVEELCGVEVPKSTVSDLCKQLDPIIKEWKERFLGDKRYPFILVDAIVIKVRISDKVRQQSVLIATGINEEGYREVIGMEVADSETEISWTNFFRGLKDRGLKGVDLVVSDDHSGLTRAAQKCFQGALWQRCQTHFIRNVLDSCPKSQKEKLHSRLKRLFEATDMEEARKILKDMLIEFGDKAPKAMECLENGFEDALAIMALPEGYRKRLRTTNSVERLNEEIRRRERVIRIFPNIASVERLIGALLMELDEVISTGHRYFNMSEYFEYKKGLEQEVPVLNTKEMEAA